MAPLHKSKSAIQATDQLQIQHFTHQHILHKIYMTFEFNCDGCNTGGYGVRYRCSSCDFDLHEKCANSPHRVSSHLHPHHQLVLLNRQGDTHFCNVCRGFTNGLSYTCESPTCEFNVHTLCIQTPVANGIPSMTLDQGQQAGGVSWGQPATSIGGHHQRSNSQPMMFDHQYQKNEQKHMNVPTRFGGFNGVNDNNMPIMINHQMQPQKQGMPTTSFGYNEVNVSQPVTINQPQPQPELQHQHQYQQGIPITEFGGYNGVNNGQPATINHHQQQQQQQKQGMLTAAFNGYNGVTNTNSQPIMVNHQQHQQQQGMLMAAFNGYNGVNNNQQLMINPQHQQQGMLLYNGMNSNQQMMMNQQQQQQPGKTNNYSKVGKFAANILSTSLIGIPLFNTRN